MPRIPVRTEPYTSPARQQRHYKNKRDQMLRTLGKASYINGSHFAILLVSAKGEVETFASELLKPCLSSWFNGNVVEEARNMATRARTMQQQQAQLEKHAESSPATALPILSFPNVDDEGDMALEDMPESPSPSRDGSPFSINGPSDGLLRPSVPGRSQSMRTAPKLATLDTDVANHMFKYRSTSASYAQSPASTAPSVSPNPVGPAMQTLVIPMNQADAWFTDKLHALQQTTCKLVAKCWIKVIEPKKQTKHPYNLGEEGKPIWWPKGLQHREPDHLLKPERTQLLLSILRSPLILVSRLELSTAEQNHLIPPERIAILRELYKVAREDEKRRRGEVPADQDIVVQVPAPPPNSAPRMPWPGDENYNGEMDFSRKRPRLSDQENDGQSWPHMHGDVSALGERINGVPSPALSGHLNQCMSGLGQPIEMRPGDGPFMYAAPPTWPNSNQTLQLPAGDFYFHASPLSDVSRPVTATTFESGPSRPLTANTSLESDVSDDRMQFPGAMGNSLNVPHLLHRSHSFPGSAHPQIDMNFGGASPMTYSQQAPAFALNEDMTGPPSQAEAPNPFGFAPNGPHNGQFTFNMPESHFQDASSSFESHHPSSSLTASPDSWASPSEERSQNSMQIMPMAIHIDGAGAHGAPKDSPSMGMMQWLNDSVHGTPAVDGLQQEVS
ncbi:hypothetical protein CALVIDRAFT_559477 [Calocera viscosa TUFC12733]|uniref:Subtelomeric hrmA-associated cluster protein AFUB-079030/YDR124W-like helical bundle domain-containing protein n=1 Tax=Calocera viscosa (strain TUFC12733) TaxID=1330018 RepID=A0A167S8J7_CALVF|nr:hypothetical protein CALVIDRAFT_559477 [Calocera viscosa TUFC12733]